MNVLLDASAYFAYLFKEKGWDIVEHALYEGAGMSAVNLSEIILKLQRYKVDEQEIRTALASVPIEIIQYDSNVAEFLTEQAFKIFQIAGFSLADRICLATAASLSLPVFTADLAWKDLDIGVSVRVIR